MVIYRVNLYDRHGHCRGDMNIYAYGDKQPIFKGNQIFIADNATIIGDVLLGNRVSIWYGAVIRGDVDKITIGDDVNIQDNCVLHVDEGFPLEISKGVTVGHGAVIHSCTVGENCLVGINATILTGAKIGRNCVIGANSLVRQNKVIPDNSMVFGVPAKVIKRTTEEQLLMIQCAAEHYVHRINLYKNLQKLDLIL